MLFSSENILVRKMNNDSKDMSLLLEWLTTPAVAELVYAEGVPWDMEKVRAEFGEKTKEGSIVTPCFIAYDGKEMGYIQFYPIEENSYFFNEVVPFSKFAGGYGMDIFIGYPDLWGKEIGTKTIRAMVGYLMDIHNANVVCADPEEGNERSVRSWTKAGFSRIGKIRNYDTPNKKSVFMAVFRQ